MPLQCRQSGHLREKTFGSVTPRRVFRRRVGFGNEKCFHGVPRLSFGVRRNAIECH